MRHRTGRNAAALLHIARDRGPGEAQIAWSLILAESSRAAAARRRAGDPCVRWKRGERRARRVGRRATKRGDAGPPLWPPRAWSSARWCPVSGVRGPDSRLAAFIRVRSKCRDVGETRLGGPRPGISRDSEPNLSQKPGGAEISDLLRKSKSSFGSRGLSSTRHVCVRVRGVGRPLGSPTGRSPGLIGGEMSWRDGGGAPAARPAEAGSIRAGSSGRLGASGRNGARPGRQGGRAGPCCLASTTGFLCGAWGLRDVADSGWRSPSRRRSAPTRRAEAPSGRTARTAFSTRKARIGHARKTIRLCGSARPGTAGNRRRICAFRCSGPTIGRSSRIRAKCFSSLLVTRAAIIRSKV